MIAIIANNPNSHLTLFNQEELIELGFTVFIVCTLRGLTDDGCLRAVATALQSRFRRPYD